MSPSKAISQRKHINNSNKNIHLSYFIYNAASTPEEHSRTIIHPPFYQTILKFPLDIYLFRQSYHISHSTFSSSTQADTR